jgi:DNA-binding NarL/FixJ family response regulator
MNTLLVASDDCVVASGLAQIVNETADLRFAGTCSLDAAQVNRAIVELQPDIVVLDIGVSTCLSVVGEIRKANPTCRLCLRARHLPAELAYQALTMGVRGILRRPVPASELVKCFRALCRDEAWIEEQLMAGFFSRPAVRLTPREAGLVNLLAQGLKNKEIAYTLSLSEGTVKVYLSRLFEKLQVKDRLELALYGIRNLTSGYVPDTRLPDVPQSHGAAGTYQRPHPMPR